MGWELNQCQPQPTKYTNQSGQYKVGWGVGELAVGRQGWEGMLVWERSGSGVGTGHHQLTIQPMGNQGGTEYHHCHVTAVLEGHKVHRGWA